MLKIKDRVKNLKSNFFFLKRKIRKKMIVEIFV